MLFVFDIGVCVPEKLCKIPGNLICPRIMLSVIILVIILKFHRNKQISLLLPLFNELSSGLYMLCHFWRVIVLL